jgi:hypothetical protein
VACQALNPVPTAKIGLISSAKKGERGALEARNSEQVKMLSHAWLK